MLKKIIVFLLTIWAILCFSHTTVKYQRIESPKIAVEAPVKPLEASKPKVIAKSKPYSPPTGKVAEIALYVARETNVDVEIISRIIFYESGYNLEAKHLNNNKTFDSGLFQINDIHRPEAESMGLNINETDDNVSFAIHLINESGLSPWSASKKNWESS